MTFVQNPSPTPVLSDRLRERLVSLGIAIAAVGSDGRLMPLDDMSPIERLIIKAPAFIATVRRHWSQISQCSGEAVRVWPGVWLVPMPTARRRRVVTKNQLMAVAMLFDHDLLDSEHLHLLCDQQELDLKATLARIDRDSLMTRSEVDRMAKSLGWMKQDSVELDRRVFELQTMSQQLAESYEELSLMYKLSSNMMVNQTPVNFLDEACTELQQVVGLRWLSLQIVDQELGLGELAGSIFEAGDSPVSTEALKRIGVELIEQIRADPKTQVLDKLDERKIENLTTLGDHLLIVPLVRGEKLFGMIFGAEKLDNSHISSIDSKLCSSLASTMSIFLQNAMLFEDMQGMFMGTLHALTSSIDAKDSYTHGHSERVAQVSRALADAVGLDAHTCDRIYIAGLLHDVGKIGVPESVLCKPGRLTVAEFELIKQHPEIGARILKDIQQMNDLIPGVLYHHERWDGNGYPHRLAGESIDLFGRILGLADAFDAMSTNRTYRRALKHQDVIDEIVRCSGTQFDPTLVDLFLKLDFEPFFDLVLTHQASHKGHDPISTGSLESDSS